jgi:hypothetical protein
MIRAKSHIVNSVSLARIWRDTVDQTHHEKLISPKSRQSGVIENTI